MNKFMTVNGLGVLLIIVWVLFALIDMWFDVVNFTTFIKISISMLTLFLLALLLRYFYSTKSEK